MNIIKEEIYTFFFYWCILGFVGVLFTVITLFRKDIRKAETYGHLVSIVISMFIIIISGPLGFYLGLDYWYYNSKKDGILSKKFRKY